MDSLEANFPHWFPNAPNLQELVPLWKRHGDRGLASDEVLRSGNQVQCNKTYLSGLLLEQHAIKTLILENPRAFGLCEIEAFEEDVPLFVTKAVDNLVNVNLEVRRLKSHPELFSDTQARAEFLQDTARAGKEINMILDGYVPDFSEAARVAEEANAKEWENAPVEPSGPPREPWQTWCGLHCLPTSELPQTLKDFKANHPEMVLIGEQLVPHMGVLIAEHWRLQVERVIVALTEKHPDIVEFFPKVENMVSGVKNRAGGVAVLMFAIQQPAAATYGTVSAFGTQENIAKMARMMASCRWNNDITILGMPRAVMFGIFVTCEEAKKFPHLRHLE